MSAEATYQIEPELRSPRFAHLKKEVWREVWGMALVGLVIACIVGAFAWRDLRELSALQKRGVAAEAIITDKRVVHSKTTTYHISYSLERPDVSIDDEAEVGSEIYARKQIGDKLIVTFLPGDAAVHRLGRVANGRIEDREVLWVLGMLAVGGCFGLMVFCRVHDTLRGLYLARYGVPAMGTIANRMPSEVTADTRTYTVTYRFLSPEGEKIHRCMLFRGTGEPFCIGDRTTILYDPTNPSRSCPYSTLSEIQIV